MTNYAAPDEVTKFASNLPQEHLLCREMGHLWSPWAARRNYEDHCFERALRCERCFTERWQILSLRGEVLSSHYKYAEGYQHKGLGRIVGEGRDMLRLESITRAIDETEK